MDTKNVIIVGGGLAGLTAAIHLSLRGFPVTVIEKNEYPKHKVCGEYVSNEVLPYLGSLGINPAGSGAVPISKLLFSDTGQHQLETQLPLGGFGISRFTLDLLLYKEAVRNGCSVIHQTVTDISFTDEKFHVSLAGGEQLSADIVLGAFGKKSKIDISLARKFTSRPSPWLAVKSHYWGEWPSDTVGLHSFNGGYCGVSKVEDDRINVCYLADYNSFKKHKNITDYQTTVLSKNQFLRNVFKWDPIFDAPLAISQISFERKLAVEHHMLMIGDTAGLIHPLCGNGMAMAIHSAKIASELTESFLTSEITRVEMESRYSAAYSSAFSSRLTMGRMLAGTLRNTLASNLIFKSAIRFPALLTKIIEKTHGNLIPAISK
ncbi:MAG: FAD-dependent oxidoreductase [Flavobacterium sp.]|nr:FAD-dependent oxidoreductase [Flavobacterium sp.]